MSDGKTTRIRQRSPAYPYFNLEVAVEKLQRLYDKVRTHPAPFVMAATHMGYKPTSGAATKAVAALKKFGLIEGIGAGTKGRQLKLSDRGLRIVQDKRPGSQERQKAIFEAAIAPVLYRTLWEKWGAELPTDQDIQYQLVNELGFVEEAAPSVTRDYRKTLAFAKPGTCAILEDGDLNTGGASAAIGGGLNSPKIGDFVQWTSQGVMRFQEPRRITGLSEDGEWVFLEGSKTGVPVTELTIEKSPNEPPANPAYVPIAPELGTKEFPLYLSGGRRALLRIPEKMTAADFELLTTQITSSLSITKATTTFVDAGADGGPTQ